MDFKSACRGGGSRIACSSVWILLFMVGFSWIMVFTGVMVCRHRPKPNSSVRHGTGSMRSSQRSRVDFVSANNFYHFLRRRQHYESSVLPSDSISGSAPRRMRTLRGARSTESLQLRASTSNFVPGNNIWPGATWWLGESPAHAASAASTATRKCNHCCRMSMDLVGLVVDEYLAWP
jgi:hypothetical protein